MKCLVTLLTFLLTTPSLFGQQTGSVRAWTSLQINWSTIIPDQVTNWRDQTRFLYLDRVAVFPGTALIGAVRFFNNRDDTVKLAPDGHSMMEYMHLTFTRRSDSSRTVQQLPYDPHPISKNGSSKWAASNKLPPQDWVECRVECPWDSMATWSPDSLDCQFIYDNTAAAHQDTSVFLLTYASPRVDPFYLEPPLTSRADSLYYLNQQAYYRNREERFEESLDLCLQILEIDSVNFTAISTAADVLWKMNRFDEGLVYAQRGLALLQAGIQAWEAEGSIHARDGTEPYVERMQLFIDKCQRREKWKWSE